MESSRTEPLKSRVLPAALGIVAACLAFGSNSLFVKIVSARHDAWTISLVRFIVGVVLSSACILLVSMRRGTGIAEGFAVRDVKGMALRAIFGFAQMVLFFSGVALTSSGRATLLMCTHPIFAAVFGLLLFGERLPKTVFLGVAGGFAGAAIVLYDGSSYGLAGNLLCLAAAASNGIGMHFVKRVRRGHSPFLVYLAPSLLGLVCLSFALPGLSSVDGGDLLLMLAIGLLSFTGQILMSWGLKFIPATAGSMIGLSEIVFAISLSTVFLGETMLPRFFLGAGLVVGALSLTFIILNNGRRQPD